MEMTKWQLQTPINAVIFDCDGTLSSIEGIDELAENNGVAAQVKTLTAEAMGKTGINPELYQKRLELVKPNEDAVIALGEKYFEHRVQDARNVIQVFNRLKKNVYIVSAGLYPAVALFGAMLQVPHENIYAVDLKFDLKGSYLDYDHASPLQARDGKREIVAELKKRHPEIIYVGDGMNDLAVLDLVERFIGYGGSFFRENIAAASHFYINTVGLASLLPLALTAGEVAKLMPSEQIFYQKGLVALQEGKVLVRA